MSVHRSGPPLATATAGAAVLLVAAQLLTAGAATFQPVLGDRARVALAQGERPAAGVITTYAGTRPMPQMAAGPEQLSSPEAVVVAPDGAL